VGNMFDVAVEGRGVRMGPPKRGEDRSFRDAVWPMVVTRKYPHHLRPP